MQNAQSDPKKFEVSFNNCQKRDVEALHVTSVFDK